jgi:integrase/recombinase XerD
VNALAPHVSEWLRERLPLELGASRHTCETYTYAMKLWFEYAADRHGVRPSDLSLEQLDAATVAGFCVYLDTMPGNSANTRNARLAAIRSFMCFIEYRVPAMLEQIRQINAIPNKRTDRNPSLGFQP